MFDLVTIEKMERQAERRSRILGLYPMKADVNGDEKILKCPFIGGRCPRGFKRTELFFVDNSGFGTESESALTARQFLTKVKQGFYYAIKQAGQFQVYIQEFISKN